ncbi:MAG: putative transposase [Alphaproteobacteria bacterium]|jgi:putative transposase
MWQRGSCNTELFMAWVQEQLVPSLKKGQVVVMDNVSFHKSPRIRTAIDQAGFRLIYLLAFSLPLIEDVSDKFFLYLPY